MTIQVLLQGHKQVNRFYTYNCVQCDSRLRACPADGTYYESGFLRGVKVICPICLAPRRIGLNLFSEQPLEAAFRPAESDPGASRHPT
jgi:hypothetical protein